MEIAIIDYKAGNIKSVEAALQRLGCHTLLTTDHQVIRSADKVVFPGVGHASAAMDALRAAGLDTLIPSLKQPVLGICLGMQMMCRQSQEGNTPGLAIFDTEVTKFVATEGEKIPHMGWNQITSLKSPLMNDIPEGSFMYFVHSYMVPISEHTIAACRYAQPFAAAIARDNFYGCQFHPEKSGRVGLKIIENFIKL